MCDHPWCIMACIHLEPDILECEVKWALGSITMNKASGGDGISWAISNPKRWYCESASLNMPANLENSAVATGLEKVNFHSNPKERQCQRMLKLSHSCTHLQFSSVQSLSRARLFATSWVVARQASLSITNSRNSLRLTSIESVMSPAYLGLSWVQKPRSYSL